MPIFQVPVTVRSISFSAVSRKCILKCLDGCGFFLRYNEGDDISNKSIRRFLVEVKNTTCFVEAPGSEQVLERFYQGFEATRTGGDSPDSKAMWIRRDKPIIELPACSLLHTNSRCEFICGELDPQSGSEQGIFGGCVLGDYDPLEGCPIASFRREYFDWESMGGKPKRKIGPTIRSTQFDYVSELDLC